MNPEALLKKLRRRLWVGLVHTTRKSAIYPLIYPAYWHYLFNKGKSVANTSCYYGAIPNPGAGIGHQLANWIAGYWYARQFGLEFVHVPFSTARWEEFLGFGANEATIKELERKGYKTRKLPMFGWDNDTEIELNKAIIRSYAGNKVIFLAEQDQYYKDQIGVIDELKRKFNDSKSRSNDKVIYDPNSFNIAVHVRRTVVIGTRIIDESEEIRALRWLDNDYYATVLRQVLETIAVDSPASVYIFSTGRPEEFKEFDRYANVHFCSDMDEYETFLHLVKADLLITSKSSFSYKPALISDGIKICPRHFWHGYPEERSWIMAENDGTFDTFKLKEALE